MSSSYLSSSNIIWIVLSALIPICFGLVLSVSILRNLRRPASYLLSLMLAPGLGLAITSVIYFFWILIYQPKYALERYVTLEGILLFILTLVCGTTWLRNRRNFPSPGSTAKSVPFRFNFISGISIAGAVTLSLAFIAFLNNWQIANYDLPEGNWDAWAIWNLRARFIYAGELWKDGFNAALSWTHPDYPLLLPGSIARIWVLLGSRTQAVPILINLIFILSILGVMMAGVALMRGWKTAVFAGLFTLPILRVSLSFLQYADMPLAFFFLAANLLLFLADVHRAEGSPQASASDRPAWLTKMLRWVHKERNSPTEKQNISSRSGSHAILILVGLATGAAIWTKDEGWVLLVAIGVSELVRILLNRYPWREVLIRVAYFLVGILPLLAAVLIYKRMSNVPDNLLSGILSQDIVAKVIDPSRYWTILKAFLQQFISYGSPHIPLLPLLIIYLIMVGANLRKPERSAVLSLVVRAGIIACIYFGIYLVTPQYLPWHLNTSLARLISQLMPSVILIVFLSSRSIEDFERRAPEMTTPVPPEPL